MTQLETRIAENLAGVQHRIKAARQRSARAADAVTLVAVTKYAESEWVRVLLSLGVHDLGESRPQQLIERSALLDESARWHMIGHLQRNKARRLLPVVSLLHSVDSLRLLSAIDRMAGEEQHKPRVLLEVNVSGEAAKNGFSPDEIESEWEAVRRCENVRVDGLMTMAPLADDPEQSRSVFRSLRELRDHLGGLSNGQLALPELSMGMSRDFEVAVEEGATLVRIGSDLFAGLEKTQ